MAAMAVVTVGLIAVIADISLTWTGSRLDLCLVMENSVLTVSVIVYDHSFTPYVCLIHSRLVERRLAV